MNTKASCAIQFAHVSKILFPAFVQSGTAQPNLEYRNFMVAIVNLP